MLATCPAHLIRENSMTKTFSLSRNRQKSPLLGEEKTDKEELKVTDLSRLRWSETAVLLVPKVLYGPVVLSTTDLFAAAFNAACGHVRRAVTKVTRVSSLGSLILIQRLASVETKRFVCESGIICFSPPTTHAPS
jgi:hypothetical protein